MRHLPVRQLWMGAVFAFLYLPVISLVLYAFNDSVLVTTWGGWSLRWFRAVLEDRELGEAFFLSLRIALLCGALSVVLGTFAAYALARCGPFRGRQWFRSLLNMPLVMPEVVIGLSVMLLVIAMRDSLGTSRGMSAILVGHVQLGTAYAAVMIAARLYEIDRSLEEAAQDLGARPFDVFRLVTLPLLVPSLVSAFLLTFTLSFDDVVISAFLAGPGSTTLPVTVFARAKFGLHPTINAVAALTIGAVTVAVVVHALMQQRRQRLQARRVA